MATWPGTLPTLSVNYSGSLDHNTVKTAFEAGYVQTRARFTRERESWTLGWMGITSAEFRTFTSFVVSVKGAADSFTFVDPVDAASTYLVRFRDDSIQWMRLDNNRYRVMFTLEEV